MAELVERDILNVVDRTIAVPAFAECALRKACAVLVWKHPWRNDAGLPKLLPLRFQLRHGKTLQVDFTLRIFVLPRSNLLIMIHGTVNVQNIPLNILPAKPNQLSGAQPVQDRKTVCVDAPIRLTFAVQNRIFQNEQVLQLLRSQNILVRTFGAARYLQIHRNKRCILSEATETQKAGNTAPQVLQRLLRKMLFSVGIVDDCLQMIQCERFDFPASNRRADVVLDKIFVLLDVARTSAFPNVLQIGVQQFAALCIFVFNTAFQPAICLLFRSNFTLCAFYRREKSTAHTVLLHLDLPTVR